MEGKQSGTIFFFILYFIATVLKWLCRVDEGACMIEHQFLPESTVLGSQEGFLQLQRYELMKFLEVRCTDISSKNMSEVLSFHNSAI